LGNWPVPTLTDMALHTLQVGDIAKYPMISHGVCCYSRLEPPAQVAAPAAAAPGQDATSRLVLLPPHPLMMTLGLLYVLRVDTIKEDAEVNTMICRMRLSVLLSKRLLPVVALAPSKTFARKSQFRLPTCPDG
jgi:hypothetical protein